MAIAIEPLEVLSERWVDHSERAAREFLLGDYPHERVSWALACVLGGAYTLTRRAGRALSLTVPGNVRNRLGWNPGDRVVLSVTERGALEVRLATEDDLSPIARVGAARADWLLAQQRPVLMLKHFEKHCEQCSKLYCARRTNQRFCPTCGLLRQRQRWRAYWQRKGKLTPSYQTRLKGRPQRGFRPQTIVASPAGRTMAKSTPVL